MDIKSFILNQLPTDAVDKIAAKAGVKGDVIKKIMSAGSEEIVKEGVKTEGGLFDNLENTILSKTIASKTGLDEGIVSKVLKVALPYIKERIDGDELKKIIGGLADGFGMDDIQNIASAVLSGNDSQKEKKSSGSGLLGGLLGGLFGGKK
jgi:hypothetical protein